MNPTSKMLSTLLACYERPDDMRMNQALDESDIAETLRIAIECIEMKPAPDMVTIPRRVAFSFAGSVQGLFTSDAQWSLYDLDGARAFCEAIRFTPEKEALDVEK